MPVTGSARLGNCVGADQMQVFSTKKVDAIRITGGWFLVWRIVRRMVGTSAL